MQFGVFDHMNRGEQGIGPQYRDRLQLIAAYEGAGFHLQIPPKRMRARVFKVGWGERREPQHPSFAE